MTASISQALHSPMAFHGQTNPRGFSDFAAGQIVSVKVLRRLNEQHYAVALRGQAREVQSEQSLPVGDTIEAVVVSASEKLELRQLTNDNAISAGNTQIPMTSLVLDDLTDVAAQAKFYKCDLGKAELRTLQSAVNASSDPDSMSLAGLFLSKRGVTVEPVMLQQLYALQTTKGTSGATPAMGLPQQITDNVDSNITVAGLAQAMRAVLETHAGEMAHSVGAPEKETNNSNNSKVPDVQFSGRDAANPSAVSILSQNSANNTEQDNDHGRQAAQNVALHDLLSDVDVNGLGARYGTLPVLINGELVELELVMFNYRQKELNTEPVKRLVMSIHTQALGTVSITAEALNQRLLVNISTETTEHAETLGAYASDVRALADRFGWNIESVAYEVKSHGVKLARRVMEHSIRQGVIDHVW